MTTTTAVYGASAAADASDVWLKLQQVPVPKSGQTANISDLIKMYINARSGLSARTYQASRCPATVEDETVTIHLQVMVFPSSLDLPYTLDGQPVQPAQPVTLRAPREFDVIIPMANRVDLGFIAENFEILEATQFYGPDGGLIPRPGISISGSYLLISEICFAVLRVRCIALGWIHDLDLSVTKQDGYNITNLSATVQATWMDNDILQSDSLEMEIPDCVEALLATCPDGTLAGIAGTSKTNPDNPDKKNKTVVWYSTCTGSILRVDNE